MIGLFLFAQKFKGTVQAPSNSSLPSAIYCTQDEIDAVMSTEGAAGNIYGTITIKNISSRVCAIEGDKYIAVQYSPKNIQVVTKGEKGSVKMELQPNQTVYSQIHYPNGPQCSGSTKDTPVNFSYQLSPTSIITFAPSGHIPSVMMPTCMSDSEITKIDVWSISANSLH